MTNLSLFAALAVAVLPLACSSSSASGAKQSAAAIDGTDAGWERIIDGSWTLAPNEEKTRLCFKKLLTEDIYVKAIRPIHPRGTHHTIVTLGDGTTDCTTAVASGLVYAAGIGTNGVELPEGVAMKLPKGMYLNLGLHLYNTTPDTLTGTTAIEIVPMAAKDVKYESETLLAGPLGFSLPAHQQTVLQDSCAITSDQSVYALFPHMHQLGTHIKTTFTLSGEDRIMHDADYDFSEQLQIPIDPVIPMHAGDKVTTECTFMNDTANTVGFGESSETEMCFSVLFRYPKQGSNGFCFSGSVFDHSDGGASPALPGPACAAPGAAGNEVGVGKQCSKGTSDCTNNTKADLCLADYATGAFANFCTSLCSSDSECGTGAKCQGPTGRSVCVPDACIATDAGAAP